MFTKIELFESTNLNALNFCLWDGMNNEVYKRLVDGYTRRIVLSFWMLLPTKINVKINSDEHHAIFAK